MVGLLVDVRGTIPVLASSANISRRIDGQMQGNAAACLEIVASVTF